VDRVFACRTLEFVDGAESVRIEQAFPLDGPGRTIGGMVALAGYVDNFA
jgi:hypothetical protein